MTLKNKDKAETFRKWGVLIGVAAATFFTSSNFFRNSETKDFVQQKADTTYMNFQLISYKLDQIILSNEKYERQRLLDRTEQAKTDGAQWRKLSKIEDQLLSNRK